MTLRGALPENCCETSATKTGLELAKLRAPPSHAIAKWASQFRRLRGVAFGGAFTVEGQLRKLPG